MFIFKGKCCIGYWFIVILLLVYWLVGYIIYRRVQINPPNHIFADNFISVHHFYSQLSVFICINISVVYWNFQLPKPITRCYREKLIKTGRSNWSARLKIMNEKVPKINISLCYACFKVSLLVALYSLIINMFLGVVKEAQVHY